MAKIKTTPTRGKRKAKKDMPPAEKPVNSLLQELLDSPKEKANNLPKLIASLEKPEQVRCFERETVSLVEETLGSCMAE